MEYIENVPVGTSMNETHKNCYEQFVQAHTHTQFPHKPSTHTMLTQLNETARDHTKHITVFEMQFIFPIIRLLLFQFWINY